MRENVLRRIVDRSLAVLLIVVAGGGHTAGAIATYHDQPIALLSALGMSVLAILIGALNLLRTNRPNDRALAWLAVGATSAWFIISVIFGLLIGNLLDPRVIGFVFITAGLIYFGLTTALPPANPTRTAS
jgi:hypothetical protein